MMAGARCLSDPFAKVREEINAVYRRADESGDTNTRHLALMLLSDLTRRRREAGLPEYRIELQSHAGRA